MRAVRGVHLAARCRGACIVNDLLRSHVTSTAFNLTLGPTHIAALIYVDIVLADGRPAVDEATNTLRTFDRPNWRPWNQFSTGFDGLERRGLVAHICDREREPGENELHMKQSRIWEITPAGRAVIVLLKECGLYAEYSAQVPAVTVRPLGGRR